MEWFRAYARRGGREEAAASGRNRTRRGRAAGPAGRWTGGLALLTMALAPAACGEMPVMPPLEPAAPSAAAAGSMAPAGDVVGISEVEAASGREYLVEPGGMAEGATQYADRGYPLLEVPAALHGATYIRTRNNDQAVGIPAEFLSFTIDREAVISVAYDENSRVPPWLSLAFTPTEHRFVHQKPGEQRSFRVYQRTFPAGRVELGSNRPHGGRAAMYTVVAQATGAPPPQGPDFREIVDGVRPRGFGQGSYSLLQPAPGRTMFWVATNGSDAHPGTSAQPFRTINRAAQVARAGDVVTIRNGTYTGNVRAQHPGTPDRRVVFQAENRGGVVLTGGSHTFAPRAWNGSVMQSGAVYVTVRGLIFREYSRAASVVSPPNRPAVAAIRGWRIEDCLFDRAGHDAVMIRGDDVEILRSTFQYTHTHAITAGTGESPHGWSGEQLRSIRVIDSVLRRNNTRPDPLQHPVSTRVVKFMMTDDVLVDNIESYENYGPGWWFDRYNSNYTVRNSYFHGNRNDLPHTRNGRGIFLEVNQGPGRVERNVFADNAREAVGVYNSERLRIVDNLMVDNDRCVILSATDRGGPDRLHDVRIEDNFCKAWSGASAIHPQGPLIATPAAHQIRADGNTYDPGDVELLTWWPHAGGLTTIPQMQQQLGWEHEGRIAPIQWPLQ